METKKWLNIIVDGSSALGPYWPKIVSDYLKKIVRSFFGNSREKGVRPSCEVGLIMYNTSSDLGLNVYINWTRDVDNFLSMLSYLTFNGDNLNQHTIAEGLARALVMFPRPSNRMTMQEYFEGERHSILVATGDPVAKRMPVSLPMIKEGNFVEGEFKPLNANFLEVAKMFSPLGVTLSVITPMKHPMFTATTFNLGNSLMVNTPIIDYGIGECTVLLSRNFKEPHYVFHKKRTVELLKTSTDATFSLIFTNNRQEDLFPAGRMTIGQESVEGVQNVRPKYAARPLATNEIHLPTPSCSQPMNVVDDVMEDADLSNDNDIFLPPIFEDETLRDLLEEAFGQDQTQVLKDTTLLAGEGSSKELAQELGSNMGVVNPILSSENCPNSSLLLPQNNTNLTWTARPNEWYHQSGMNSTTVGLGTVEPHDPTPVGASFGVVNPIDPPAVGGSFGNDDDIFVLPMLEEDDPILNDLLDDAFGQDQTQVLNMGSGEGSSRGLAQELGGNMGVVNPILSSENCSNSSLSLPQNNTNLGPAGPNEWYHQSGMNSTTVELGTVEPHDPPPVGASFGNDNDIFVPPMLDEDDTILKDLLIVAFGQDQTEVQNMGAGEGSSRGLAQELGGNMGVVNPILSSENCSNSSLSLPQNKPNLWPTVPSDWYHQSGMNSTTVGLGTMNPHDAAPVGASFGNSIFPNTTTNSLTQFQSISFPELPYASSSSSSHQQVPRNHHNEMNGLSPLGKPAMGANTWDSPAPMMPQYNNQSHFFPHPQSLADIQDFVHEWELD